MIIKLFDCGNLTVSVVPRKGVGGFICLTFSPFIIVTLSFFRDFKRQMKTGILWARTKYGSVKAAGKYSQLDFNKYGRCSFFWKCILLLKKIYVGVFADVVNKKERQCRIYSQQ